MNNLYLRAAKQLYDGIPYACWGIHAAGGDEIDMRRFCARFNTHNLGPAFFNYNSDGSKNPDAKQCRVLALLFLHWITNEADL